MNSLRFILSLQSPQDNKKSKLAEPQKVSFFTGSCKYSSFLFKDSLTNMAANCTCLKIYYCADSLLKLIPVSGLPAPLPAGADVDFVVVEADQEPREGRVLVSSFDDSNFRLPLPGAQDDDVVVIEAGEPDDRSGRFISDIPRDRNFGIVAGPRLPLPEDDIVVVEVRLKKKYSTADIPF